MDFQNQRVLLRRIEVRRLEDPALDLAAVEARIPDFFGLALQMSEKSGSLTWVIAAGVRAPSPTGSRCRRCWSAWKWWRRCASRPGRGIRRDVVSPVVTAPSAPARRDALQVRAAVLGRRDDQRRAVAPDDRLRVVAARRGLVAADAAADVVVVGLGQVLRRCCPARRQRPRGPAGCKSEPAARSACRQTRSSSRRARRRSSRSGRRCSRSS